jgi:hypothetical protein
VRSRTVIQLLNQPTNSLLILSFIYSSIHCLTTGLYRLPNRVLHTVRSSASYYIFLHPFVSLRSSSSCLRLLSRLPPSITCIRRHFPRKIAFVPFTVRRIIHLLWLFLTLLHFSHDRCNTSPSFSSTTLQTFLRILIHFPKCPSFRTIQSYAPNVALHQFLP